MKVRPRQGRSGPPGSECCAAVGDGGREAYTAVVWGVGMSHERHHIVGAETVGSVEGKAAAAGPCDVSIVPDCDHYYKGRSEAVAAIVSTWLRKLPLQKLP